MSSNTNPSLGKQATQCPFYENHKQCEFRTSDNLEYIKHKEEHEARIRNEDMVEFEQYCKEHPVDCNCAECRELGGIMLEMIMKGKGEQTYHA